ncbi:hypothetical protein BDR07DRAFT_1376037 [Suillus spraguei]|nr:hypothetical protein BDR07DRAFT_1376037 [Suillus spraguei]
MIDPYLPLPPPNSNSSRPTSLNSGLVPLRLHVQTRSGSASSSLSFNILILSDLSIAPGFDFETKIEGRFGDVGLGNRRGIKNSHWQYNTCVIQAVKFVHLPQHYEIWLQAKNTLEGLIADMRSESRRCLCNVILYSCRPPHSDLHRIKGMLLLAFMRVFAILIGHRFSDGSWVSEPQGMG